MFGPKRKRPYVLWDDKQRTCIANLLRLKLNVNLRVSESISNFPDSVQIRECLWPDYVERERNSDFVGKRAKRCARCCFGLMWRTCSIAR